MEKEIFVKKFWKEDEEDSNISFEWVPESKRRDGSGGVIRPKAIKPNNSDAGRWIEKRSFAARIKSFPVEHTKAWYVLCGLVGFGLGIVTGILALV